MDELRQRFLAKVEKLGNCWLWQAACDPNGYGRFWYKDQMRLAHRVSYELFEGPIGNLQIRHKCVNTSCVNPEHLELGTHADNMQDLAEAGTNKIQKIHYPTAIEMRRAGNTLKEIADHFGCSITAVHEGLKRHARYE